MEYKSFEERYENEILSDNSQKEDCKQCKNCVFQSDGTVWSNDYRKCSCMVYQHPNTKPLDVIDNKAECQFFNKRKLKSKSLDK